MNKKILFLILGLAVLSIGMVSAESNCSDTDGGEDYFNKGIVSFAKVTGNLSVFTDYCSYSIMRDDDGDTYLNEHSCVGEDLLRNWTECSDLGDYSCVDGACVAEEVVVEDSCVDSDGDDPLSVGSVETYNASAGSVTFVDHCDTGTRNINEMTCDGVGLHSEITSCSTYGTGYECFETGEGAYCLLAEEEIEEEAVDEVEIEVEVEEEEETTYREVVFEFDSSMDLSEAYPSLTSVQGISIHTEDNEIVLNPYSGIDSIATVANIVETNEVFLYTPNGNNVLPDGTIIKGGKWLGVYYRDLSDNQIKLFGHVSSSISGSEIIEIQVGSTSYLVSTRRTPVFASGTLIPFTVGRDLSMAWGLDPDDGVLNSLGNTISSEEANELRIRRNGIGVEVSDQSTIDGLVIESPNVNGASDQVILQVPTSTSGLARAAADEGFSLGVMFGNMWGYFFY